MDRILINDYGISFIKDSRVENLPTIGSNEEFWFRILRFNDIVKEAGEKNSVLGK